MTLREALERSPKLVQKIALAEASAIKPSVDMAVFGAGYNNEDRTTGALQGFLASLVAAPPSEAAATRATGARSRIAQALARRILAGGARRSGEKWAHAAVDTIVDWPLHREAEHTIHEVLAGHEAPAREPRRKRRRKQRVNRAAKEDML